jgi:hypothetical protein
VTLKLNADVQAKLNVVVNHPAPKVDPAAAEAEAADGKGAKKPYKAKKA